MSTLADAFTEAMQPNARQTISVRAFSPVEIRMAIADLVAGNQLVLADALAVAGLTFYPKSEDILATGALLAQVRQDWAEADELFGKLVALNGMSATSTTWLHWIRSIQCQLDTERALATAQLAVHEHPNDSALLEAMDHLADQLLQESHCDATSVTSAI